MWFKGALVLSYTALLVTPTNAIFPHKDEVLGRRESLTARRFNRLNKRQQPWSNQTITPEVPEVPEAPETQEPELEVPETSIPVVIVPTTDGSPSTSAQQDELPSTSEVVITTETPTAIETPVISSLVPTTTPVTTIEPESSAIPSASATATSEVISTTELPVVDSTESLPETTSSFEPTTTEIATSELISSTELPLTETVTSPPEADPSPEPTLTEDVTFEPISSTDLPVTDVASSVPEDNSTPQPTITATIVTSKTSSIAELSSSTVSSEVESSQVESTTVPQASESLSTSVSLTRGAGRPQKPNVTPESSAAIEVPESSIAEPMTTDPAASDVVPSSQAISTADTSSEVPLPTSSESTLPEATETPTESQTRTRNRPSGAKIEPTTTETPISSSLELELPTDMSTTTSEEVETTVAIETTAVSEEDPVPSSIVISTTEGSESGTPTASRTRAQPTETDEAEIPVTASFDITSTTDFPESTAAASLPDLLPISSILSDVMDAPSAIASIVSSVGSDVGAILTDIGDLVSSVKSGVEAVPTDTSDAVPSSKLLTSVKPVEPTIPASETPTDGPISSAVPAIPVSTGDGISLPGATGTGATTFSSAPTDAPNPNTGDENPKSSANEDASVVPGPTTATAEPTSIDATEATTSIVVSSDDLPVFSIFDPSAVQTSAPSTPSDLASTGVPVSETQGSPTPTDAPITSVGETSVIETSTPVGETSVIETSTPVGETSVTGLPSVPSGTVDSTLNPTGETSATDLTIAPTDVSAPVASATTDATVPAPIPTSESTAIVSGTPSGVTDSTIVATSGLGVSLTSGAAIPTGFTTSASIAHPTDPAVASDTATSAVEVDTVESQVPIGAPVPTSESITSAEASTSNGEQSAVPSSTEAVPTATGVSSEQPDATTKATNDSESETAEPTSGPTDGPTDEAPSGTPAQLGPPPTIPTGFDSDPAAVSPSASSTEAPLGGTGSGEEKPPPLSKSQTAGIAVGGTTCLLIALVAALFLARRYHSNMSNKRHSTGGMSYYDSPPTNSNNHDAEAGGALPAVSGGGGAALSRSLSSASARSPAMSEVATGGAVGGAAAGGLARSVSKASSYRHSIGPVYGAQEHTSEGRLPRESRYSTGSYLSTMPWDPSLALNAAAAASSISLNQYQDEASQNPFRDPEEPKPVANRPPLGGTVNGPLAINPYEFNAFNNSPAAREFPPMSPYGPAKRNSSPVRNRASERQSDPFADPFEHDLILNVAPHASTDSSITVLAPPPTPRSAMPTRGPSPNPYEFRPPPTAPFAKHFPGRDSDSASLIPAPLNSGRNTPEGRRSPAPRESPDSQRTLVQPPPAHIGPKPQDDASWENNRVDQVDVPAPLFPKKPLPLRRQPTLAGPGQTLLASTGLPLTIKRKPMGNDSVSGELDVPRNQHLSPVPTPTAADFSDDPVVQRKRSGEMMFADPSLLGRQF